MLVELERQPPELMGRRVAAQPPGQDQPVAGEAEGRDVAEPEAQRDARDLQEDDRHQLHVDEVRRRHDRDQQLQRDLPPRVIELGQVHQVLRPPPAQAPLHLGELAQDQRHAPCPWQADPDQPQPGDRRLDRRPVLLLRRLERRLERVHVRLLEVGAGVVEERHEEAHRLLRAPVQVLGLDPLAVELEGQRVARGPRVRGEELDPLAQVVHRRLVGDRELRPPARGQVDLGEAQALPAVGDQRRRQVQVVGDREDRLIGVDPAAPLEEHPPDLEVDPPGLGLRDQGARRLLDLVVEELVGDRSDDVAELRRRLAAPQVLVGVAERPHQPLLDRLPEVRRDLRRPPLGESGEERELEAVTDAGADPQRLPRRLAEPPDPRDHQVDHVVAELDRVQPGVVPPPGAVGR